MMQYHGSCLCKKVTFTINAFMPHMAHCHCTMCQKFHGAAFSTFGEVTLENFHITNGNDEIKHFHASNDTKRSFCQQCGSSLFFQSKYNEQDKTIEVAIAALDDASGLTPDAHIFTDSKCQWLKLDDSLPKYKQYRKA